MGKVTFEFDENKESRDIELIVNRYKMICALDELEKYRYDLYNGHRDEVISVGNGGRIERDDYKEQKYKEIAIEWCEQNELKYK